MATLRNQCPKKLVRAIEFSAVKHTVYREDIRLQTLFLLFKCANYRNKKPICFDSQ